MLKNRQNMMKTRQALLLLTIQKMNDVSCYAFYGLTLTFDFILTLTWPYFDLLTMRSADYDPIKDSRFLNKQLI